MTALHRRPSPARRAPRALAAALTLGATATLAACTSTASTQKTDFTGTKGNVQDVVKRLAELADDGNAAGICKEVLTPDFGTTIGRGKSCTDGVKTAIDRADFTALDVTAVNVENKTPQLRADAIVTSTVGPDADDKQKRTFTLTRAASTDDWKIAAVSTTGEPASTPETTPATTDN